MIFRDRKDAGLQLAAALRRFAASAPVVLALPRGGVVVAFEVARSLSAPLDLILVRKIGAPWQPELAAGAVVDGEQLDVVVNEDVAAALGLSEAELRKQAEVEVEEIERRRRLYLGGREPPPLAGRTVIVVDDGIATGASVRAALRAVRRRGPRHLILAVPVAPVETLAELEPEVDEVICLATPSSFTAVGQFYADFRQVDDDEVRALLARARSHAGKAAGGGPSPPGIETKVAFLSRPEAYPERPRGVERIETHMSWVFLTDHHAYKLRKPVRYDSLDFSTPELRRIDCLEELRLNRRLAEDVYLDVVALRWDPGRGLALEGDGEPIDWLVRMRRLPAERMLDQVIRRGKVEEADLRRAARALARFYAGATPVDITPSEYRRRLEEGVCADRRELCRSGFALPRAQVEQLAGAQLVFLDEQPALFDRRVREGRIVEGHGDLRPEHICLVPEPVIIDCLEFSRELRSLDPADELAFLALECERLGAPAVGRYFLDTYARVSGDTPPPELLRFYRIYRALRRAVLAAWHLQDPSVRDSERWRFRALRYLELAAAS